MVGEKMKYLIFGHEGLIGKEIMKQCSKHEITCYDRGYSFSDIPNEKYDCIIHLAANCIIRDVIKEPKLALENIKINYRIFEYARRNNIKKIIYFSSSRVLGKESNPYVASKLYGEALCKAYKDCYGIDYLIIIPETVWSMKDKHKRVITSWIESVKKNKDIIVYGDKSKILSPIHVESFVRQFLVILDGFMKNEGKKRIYSISGVPMNVYTIFKKIVNKFKSTSNIIYEPAELTQPQKDVMNDILVEDFDIYLKKIK